MSNTISVKTVTGFVRVLKDQVGSTLPWVIHSTVVGGSQILAGDWITITPDASNDKLATVTVVDPSEQRPPLSFQATLQSDGEHLKSAPLAPDANQVAWTYSFYMNQILLPNGSPLEGATTRCVRFCFDAPGQAANLTSDRTRYQHDAGSGDPSYVPK